MKDWYKKQDIVFDNWNDKEVERRDDGHIPNKNPFYVPRGQAEHLVEFLVRNALARTDKPVGEPWVYLGWNTSPWKALDGTRSHVRHRKYLDGMDVKNPPKDIPDGYTQTKWFRESVFDLSIFMLTNRGNVAEDLEEIYNSVIQMKTEFPVDAGAIFMLDKPLFQVNTQHKILQISSPVTQHGNLWAVQYDVTITAPALEMNEQGVTLAKSISVGLYDMARGLLFADIVKNK